MANVVHLSSAHGPFDTRIFHKQAKTLASAGFDVSYVVHHDTSTVRDSVTVDGVTPPASRFDRWRNLPTFYRRAKAADADVYHFHDPELLPIGALLSRRTDAKVVYDAHEDYSVVFTERDWIPNVFQKSLAPLVPKLESLFANQCDGIVTATEWIEQSFRERGHDRVTVLHNFPIVESIKIQPPDVESDSDFVLVYVGSLTVSRGLIEMLELLEELREQIDASLWLLGPFGDRRTEERAKSYIEERGLDDAVRFFGRIPYENIFSYIGAADLGLALLDPVQYNRGIPTKVFEYMYGRTPVVASDTEANNRYVSEEYGRVVPYEDTGRQVETVVELLQDEKKRDEMGNLGRDKVLTDYSWEAESDCLLSFYRSLLETGLELSDFSKIDHL